MGLRVEIEKQLKNMKLQISFDTGNHRGITGILGASGCGKSMTLKSIAGIVTPDQGQIVLHDRVLFDSQQGINMKIQRRQVGYLFQDYALFPNMTVGENIRIVMNGSETERKQGCARYLERFQIQELEGRYPACLSGGQKQRVALARVLASNPQVLMLDEPFSALDTYLKEQLQAELLDILKSYEGEILMVTHSRDEVYRFCNSVHVLQEGHLVASGATKEVFASPKTVAVARLTGCKNIAKALPISEHRLQIDTWGIVLELEQRIPEEVDAVGIRAHYLEPVGEGQKEESGVIACNWSHVLEDPFEITGILECGLWWKVAKEEFRKQHGSQMPSYLRIPEASVLLLREE